MHGIFSSFVRGCVKAFFFNQKLWMPTPTDYNQEKHRYKVSMTQLIVLKVLSMFEVTNFILDWKTVDYAVQFSHIE